MTKFGIRVVLSSTTVQDPISLPKTFCASYTRSAITLANWPHATHEYDAYLAAGIHVLVNLTWQPSTTGPAAFPTDMADYAAKVTASLDTLAASRMSSGTTISMATSTTTLPSTMMRPPKHFVPMELRFRHFSRTTTGTAPKLACRANVTGRLIALALSRPSNSANHPRDRTLPRLAAPRMTCSHVRALPPLHSPRRHRSLC